MSDYHHTSNTNSHAHQYPGNHWDFNTQYMNDYANANANGNAYANGNTNYYPNHQGQGQGQGKGKGKGKRNRNRKGGKGNNSKQHYKQYANGNGYANGHSNSNANGNGYANGNSNTNGYANGNGHSNKNNGHKGKNVYELCKSVEQFMFKNCQKYNISPADLYEELHYQLPEEWIVSLRYIIKCSVRQEIKNEGFQTESTSESGGSSDSWKHL